MSYLFSFLIVVKRLSFGEEKGKFHFCSSLSDSLDESVCGFAGGGHIVKDNHFFSCEFAFIDFDVLVGVLCEVMGFADMRLCAFSHDMDIVVSVFCVELRAYHCRELFKPPCVGVLAACRYAEEDGVGHIHEGECIAHHIGRPPLGIVPA